MRSWPLIHEIDYGTPASNATEQVTLTIDGQEVTVPAGTSIMRAAMDAGIKIPKLCATNSLDAFGSCRVCLVRDRGTWGHAGILYDAGGAWHEGVHHDRPRAPRAPWRDGACILPIIRLTA